MEKTDPLTEAGNDRPVPAPRATDVPNAVQRAAFLDEWVAKRIEEAEAVEQRLAKRLAHVEQVEKRLDSLLQSLRTEVGTAGPLLAQLTDFRKLAETAPIQDLGAAQAEMAEVIEKGRAQIHEILETFPRSVAARVQTFKAEVQRSIAAAAKRVDERTEMFEQKAGLFEDWLDEQITATRKRIASELDERARAVERQVASRAGQAMDTARQAADAMTQSMARRIGMLQKGAEDVSALAEGLLRRSMDQLHEDAGGKVRNDK